MNRITRRTGESVMVSGLVATAACVDWLRARQELPSGVADSAGRWWEPQWIPRVGIPDMPRWQIAEDPADAAAV